MSTSAPAVELHTPRLLLRPLQLSDAEQTQLLLPHWEIVKHLNAIVPWPYPADGAFTFYRDRALPAIERGDEWHWTLRLKESPEKHIGVISLHTEAPREFSEDEVDFLVSSATLVRGAIENARLYAETRSRSLIVQSFHTFPDDCAIVKCQSHFELP